MLTFGSLSEEGRSSGIQGDAIRNIHGSLTWVYDTGSGSINNSWGALYWNKNVENAHKTIIEPFSPSTGGINLDASKVVPTGLENRTKNRKIRIYKRIA
ncbi:hypothetical protein [uncultured Brachyspira sp.]|uniref:hypothetical protein n=1 Tax=uncultured Brachyspira sp. TaxID=221953 RepID=UPI002602FA9A|nr:hypothetical protein [uncultured Brachyspira sp.]